MSEKAASPEAYLSALPEDRIEPMTKLRETMRKHLPKGFEETISSGMLSYVVPHRLYPAGYHCDPKQPLPFISIASQKNFIALYHMGLYGSPEMLEWFTAAYPKHSKTKPDMGKSCIRFKKPDQIPFALIAELAGKLTPADWISVYESALKK